MNRVLFCLAVAMAVVGCKSRPLGPYVSPRVTGQVLASDSRLPLAGVQVIRGSIDTGRSMVSPPKGGELLMRKPPFVTRTDGKFDLPSQRVLSVVRGSQWNIVSLTFYKAGYESFRTNCPTTSADNSGKGEPQLDVGPILLQPEAR